MSQVKLGDKNIPFIYQGNELLYPNPVKDGLVLYYDFKGMENSDVTKGVAKDLSGNGNDGELKNFVYTNESGYAQSLNFDGIDDYINVPNFTQDTFNNSRIFTFCFTLSFKDTLKRGTILNIPSEISSERLAVKTGIDKRIIIGRESKPRIGYKSDFIENDIFNACITVNYESIQDVKIFINGVESPLTETKFASDVYSFPQKNLTISYHGSDVTQANSSYLNNKLYSLNIYNRILTDQEIQHNYNLEKERWGL